MAQCEILFTAIKNNNLDLLRQSVSDGFVNTFHGSRGNPLDYAVSKNNLEAVKIIIEAGGISDRPLKILQKAVMTDDDNIDILQVLVNQGYRSFDKEDNIVRDAILSDYIIKLEFLLTVLDFPIDHCEKYGHNSLFYAINCQNADMVQLLLNCGANPNLRFQYDIIIPKFASILEYAQNWYPEMAKIILDYQNFPDIREPILNN